ncbi:hypothetical protein L3X38_033126 [Prunus dulcis]|uniref:Uncharacterized protein n=1 Tax=Prunus dulcis TaxID=3755 RepID=A0AAD4YXB7_PRUDU|nr:hypothetical protein L3X38_033126 [Prunus dulcis]
MQSWVIRLFNRDQTIRTCVLGILAPLGTPRFVIGGRGPCGARLIKFRHLTPQLIMSLSRVPPSCFETVSFINNAPRVSGTLELCVARNAAQADQCSSEARKDCNSNRSGISEACEDCGSDRSGTSEACEDGIDVVCFLMSSEDGRKSPSSQVPLYMWGGSQVYKKRFVANLHHGRTGAQFQKWPAAYASTIPDDVHVKLANRLTDDVPCVDANDPDEGDMHPMLRK